MAEVFTSPCQSDDTSAHLMYKSKNKDECLSKHSAKNVAVISYLDLI